MMPYQKFNFTFKQFQITFVGSSKTYECTKRALWDDKFEEIGLAGFERSNRAPRDGSVEGDRRIIFISSLCEIYT